MEFKWQVETIGQSAKQFLAQQGVSHRMFSQINHSNGQILVNNVAVAPATKLAVGDALTLIVPAEPADPNVPVSHEPLAIVSEDPNFLVVSKPAGLTVVPGPSNRTDTLVNRVKGHLVAEQEVNLVPHVITRLDRDTSGLVLLAKHRLANSWMNQELADHTLVKRYLAFVGGRLDQDHAMIDAPLRRADDGFNQIVADDGKPAQTEYWVKQRTASFTLVEVLLHTGRTHQIRAHFESIGHPLLGDALYGGDQQLITRQALHAFHLDYPDPVTHQHQTFEQPLPDDMQHLLS
ncbi:RNA pseudouridine synthase [Secundilactobacillus paracollinoides]|uniref:Pseudouridine synthase n=1 Tax=Secundilactobacillus paracollinoides TaxID=240427 RepID=A0A1B2IZ36_9LACO|nr:RluA family pseudouridine synthase [Secundilactobacillus paracollinoides]ANZ61424.1 RNA pseudouridine synthase [Secundilactobacillus paracollinoides]ANZ64185.1 RNA pseudouridine synthase [Secundilactobacillus paracollinoides]ANZ67344.1 RNA pseudouridine synthase [Secundilactobacillus paracollinoides]